jgi:hypothetical protein
MRQPESSFLPWFAVFRLIVSGLPAEGGFLHNQRLFVKYETYSRFPGGTSDARLPRLQRDNSDRT